jgi:hypothetical protein
MTPSASIASTRLFTRTSTPSELYADVQGNEPLIRYCFAQERDAAAFHAAFAGAAAKSHFKKAG